MRCRVLSFDPGIKNLAWSIVEKDNERIELISFGLINLEEHAKCDACDNFSVRVKWDDLKFIYCCKEHAKHLGGTKKIPEKKPAELCEEIINRFNMLFLNDAYDVVVIENQPSFKNPKVKSIQMIIMTYFKLQNKNVTFQNPSSKLFEFKEKTKNCYRDNKKVAIKLVTKLLNKNHLFSIKEKYTKIDDVCDSILIGTCHLFEGKTPDILKQ